MGAALDLLTVGRVSVDLYANELGASFSDSQTFSKSIGGTATNVAVAAARLGRRSAVYTKIGGDPFGDYVLAKLRGFGVDTRFVGRVEHLATPLAFAALDPPADPRLLFYRAPKAPDMELCAGEVDDAALIGAGVFWVAGSALAEEPARATIRGLLARRGRRGHTVVDLDFRPQLWSDRATAAAVVGTTIADATVVVGNRVECEVALGTADPHAAADRLLAAGVGLAVVKLGADGVLAATAGERVIVAPRPVEVVCGLGAGDAFGGALVHGLLAGWEPRRMIEFANVAGALVAGRLLCADAMPTLAELEAVPVVAAEPARAAGPAIGPEVG